MPTEHLCLCSYQSPSSRNCLGSVTFTCACCAAGRQWGGREQRGAALVWTQSAAPQTQHSAFLCLSLSFRPPPPRKLSPYTARGWGGRAAALPPICLRANVRKVLPHSLLLITGLVPKSHDLHCTGAGLFHP